jgi:hypothetical protein
MNNGKMLGNNIKEQDIHLIVGTNLVDNNNNNNDRGTIFSCTKGVKSFIQRVMMR